MPQYRDFLKNGSFNTRGSTSHRFSDPIYNGMCVPARIQNLVLEANLDIQIPPHTRPRSIGGRVMWEVAPGSRVTNWRLITKSDLIVDPGSITTPAPTSDCPHPEQHMHYKGDFILSYQLHQLRSTRLVTKESSEPEVVFGTWYEATFYGFVMNFGLRNSALELLPDCIFDDHLRLMWSLPDMPGQINPPNITSIQYNYSTLECNFRA